MSFQNIHLKILLSPYLWKVFPKCPEALGGKVLGPPEKEKGTGVGEAEGEEKEKGAGPGVGGAAGVGCPCTSKWPMVIMDPMGNSPEGRGKMAPLLSSVRYMASGATWGETESENMYLEVTLQESPGSNLYIDITLTLNICTLRSWHCMGKMWKVPSCCDIHTGISSVCCVWMESALGRLLVLKHVWVKITSCCLQILFCTRLKLLLTQCSSSSL